MPSLKPVSTVVICCLLVAVVPTAAVSLGEDATSDDAILEPTSQYASVEDNKLKLDFEALNEHAITTSDGVFSIMSHDEDVKRIWIENEVDGLTFYEGSDSNAKIDEWNPLEPSAGETVNIGVEVNTRDAKSGTETFTVHVEYEDEEDEEDDEDDPPKGIKLTDLEVDPTAVETGDTVTVNATYENHRQPAQEVTSQLTVDGTVVDTKTFEIGPGETKTVQFERQMQWPGTYEVGVDGIASESVTVEGPPVDVLEASVVDAEITAGETAAVDATVSNPTETPVNRTLELAVDGVVVDTEQVTLEPELKTTVTFEHQFDEPRTYDVAVSGVEAGTVTVSEPRSDPVSDAIQNRDLSATTAALAPPTALGLLSLFSVVNRRRN